MTSGQDQGTGGGGDHSGDGQGPGNDGHGPGDHGDRGNDGKVTIQVDDVRHKVRGGDWIVRDLKAAVGVDPAKVLAEITPHGLKDLDDNGKIEVKDGMRFMSHARSGGSS